MGGHPWDPDPGRVGNAAGKALLAHLRVTNAVWAQGSQPVSQGQATRGRGLTLASSIPSITAAATGHPSCMDALCQAQGLPLKPHQPPRQLRLLAPSHR